MDFSILGKGQDICNNEVIFDKGSIYDRLHKLSDLRKARGKRYSLVTLLMIILMAKLCGANTPMDIAEWGENQKEEIHKLLKIKRPEMPTHSTYRRILAHKVYVQEIERMVGEYNEQGKQGGVYAMDGKTIRGMRIQEAVGTEYFLSIYDVEQGKTLSQVAVGRKENEIRKANTALKQVKIAGKVITGDALLTQKGICTHILEQKGDYVFPVKENQLGLYTSIQQLFAPEYPKPGFGKIPTDFLTKTTVNKGHGRIEVRTITTSEMLNSYSNWPGLGQVYRLQRQFEWRRNGKTIGTSNQTEYGITSLSCKKASPERVLYIRRAHWSIETGLHYRRDVTLREDATRMTIGNTAKVMASINNLVLALIKQAKFDNAAQARRWYSTHLSHAFTLLVTPFS
jgi:predicted transposase YbfD/YdcC